MADAKITDIYIYIWYWYWRDKYNLYNCDSADQIIIYLYFYSNCMRQKKSQIVFFKEMFQSMYPLMDLFLKTIISYFFYFCICQQFVWIAQSFYDLILNIWAYPNID